MRRKRPILTLKRPDVDAFTMAARLRQKADNLRDIARIQREDAREHTAAAKTCERVADEAEARAEECETAADLLEREA